LGYEAEIQFYGLESSWLTTAILIARPSRATLQQKRVGAMAKRYLVTLTDAERAHLLTLTTKGKVLARQLSRAHTLLQADAGASDEAIAAALHSSIATIERTRKRFVEEGLEEALCERPRPGGQRQLDDKQEAFLIALACSTPLKTASNMTVNLTGYPHPFCWLSYMGLRGLACPLTVFERCEGIRE
jgi:putative transposase